MHTTNAEKKLFPYLEEIANVYSAILMNSRIELQVHLKNQLKFTVYLKRKREIKMSIESLISQLDGQFNMNVNFAKTMDGFVQEYSLIQLLLTD